jgi:mRNA-degrading endonuclease RelE of RelBE toxin-antitoxin system
MYELVVHRDATEDLDALYESDEAAAADIEVLLEEIRDDQTLLLAMHTHQSMAARFHVSHLLNFSIWGRELWRLKIWELEDADRVLPYRIIYAFHGNVFYVLAVMHRNQNYEQDPHLVERIKAACRSIGIPVPRPSGD